MDWADIIAARCIGDGMGDGDTRRLIAEALRAEREACAKAVALPEHEVIRGVAHGAWERGYIAGRHDAIAAIRARGAT